MKERIFQMNNQVKPEVKNVESAAKAKFEQNVSAEHNNHLAVQLTKRVVETLQKATVSNAITDVKAQLQELLNAKDTDITAVIALTEKLKNSDNDQQAKNKKALALTKEFTLAEVLTAFQPQFDELVYNLASDLLDRANVLASQGGKSVTKKKGVDNIIQNTKGETIVLPSRAGRASSNLSQDKAVWDFLNLQIDTEDGKEVFVQGTLTLNTGGEIPTSRKTIIEALELGNVKELQGFTIRKAEDSEEA